MHHPNLRLHLPMEFSLCVSVSMSKCPPSVRTQTCWIRAHPNNLTLTPSSTKKNPALQVLAVRPWGSGRGHNSTHNSVCFSGVVSCHFACCSSRTGLPTVPITGRWCLLHDITVLSVLHAEKVLLPTTIIFSLRSHISQSGPDPRLWGLSLHCPALSRVVSADPLPLAEILLFFYAFVCLSSLQWRLQELRDPTCLLDDVAPAPKTVPIT